MIVLLRVLGRTKKSKWIMRPLGKAEPLSPKEAGEALALLEQFRKGENERNLQRKA